MSEAIGVDCALSLGGVAVPAILQGCSVDFTEALQPILVANGGDPLIGYSPGSGAKSGFSTQFFLPYGTGAAAVNAALADVGLTIDLGFDAAGGVSLTEAKCVDLVISGSENNKLECRAMFESKNKPVYGSADVVSGDFSAGVWLFNDVISFTMLGGVFLDVSSFSFHLTRVPVRFVGNSPTGQPKKFGLGHREIHVDLEWLKVGNTEGVLAIADCPTTGDIIILCTQACGGSPASLTLTAHNARYEGAPKSVGGLEAYVMEQVTAVATLGAFSVN